MPRRSTRTSDKMAACKEKGDNYTYDKTLEETDKKTKGCRKKCTPKQKKSKNGRCYARAKKSPARKTTKRKTTGRKTTKKKTTARKTTRQSGKRKTQDALKIAKDNRATIDKLEKEIQKLKKSPPKKRTARKTKTSRKTKTRRRKTNTGKGKCPPGQKPIPGLNGECMID